MTANQTADVCPYAQHSLNRLCLSLRHRRPPPIYNTVFLRPTQTWQTPRSRLRRSRRWIGLKLAEAALTSSWFTWISVPAGLLSLLLMWVSEINILLCAVFFFFFYAASLGKAHKLINTLRPESSQFLFNSQQNAAHQHEESRTTLFSS